MLNAVFILMLGCVYTAFAIEANYQKVALKVIEKAPTLESLSNEVDILCKLKHPNINRLHEVIEDAKYFVIVMELARGGELFNYVSSFLFSMSLAQSITF